MADGAREAKTDGATRPSRSDASRSDELSHSIPRRRLSAWLLLPAIALIEVAGHAVVQQRMVPDDDWERAAARVRREHRAGDLIVVAPSWADPILRQHLGDRISLEDAGRSDTAQYERLWVLSIRGHLPLEAPSHRPEVSEQIGRVRVLRYRMQPDAVRYDFVEHVADARVTRIEGGTEHPCTWQRSGWPRGGGLGAGPIEPAEKHACDPARPWLWVGATMQDDLDLAPRYCIWQHPAGAEPIRATFSDVPLGDRFVLYGDLYYEHERHREHGPIDVAVYADGHEIGRMVHRDGDGWKRMEASTRYPQRGERQSGEIRVEVSAINPHLRSFCWAATTRGGRP